tara:strand:- start:534 stop:827 length:294 start_codon:yes stop_codon:yes gene_type:complete
MVDYTLVKIYYKMEDFLSVLKDYVTLIMFVSGIIVASVTSRVITHSRLKRLEEHVIDGDKHWTTEKKIQVFVPRVEIERRFENIERILLKLEKQFDK